MTCTAVPQVDEARELQTLREQSDARACKVWTYPGPDVDQVPMPCGQVHLRYLVDAQSGMLVSDDNDFTSASILEDEDDD